MPVLSPCIRVCILDRRGGLCLGCGRRLHEIAAWSSLDDTERRAIMALLPERLLILSGRSDGAIATPPSSGPT